MLIERSVRLARVRDRDSVRLSCASNEGKPTLVVCAGASLAHVVISGQIHTIVKAPSKIADVAVYQDYIYLATITGHIWVILIPTSTSNGSPHIIALQRDNRSATDSLNDPPIHKKKHARRDETLHTPLGCVPGAKSIFVYNQQVFVVTSKLYPTTLFVGKDNPTTIELLELEGEQSTGVCIVSANSSFILKYLGELVNASYVVLQGDTDGSLRYCAFSGDNEALQCGTLFEDSNKAIESVVCLGNRPSIHGLLIKYVAGEAAIVSNGDGPKTALKLDFIDSIEYHEALNSIVCISNDNLFICSLEDGNTAPSTEISLPKGIIQVVSSGPYLCCLHTSGQLFMLSFPTEATELQKCIQEQQLEAGFGGVGTSRKAGTDNSIKTQLIDIRNATEKKNLLLTKSKHLDKILQSLNAADQLLREVQENGIKSVLSCVIRGHRPLEMSRGLRTASRIVIQVDLTPNTTFQSKDFSQWVLQLIVHGEKQRQFNATCPESLGTSWRCIFEIEELKVAPMFVEAYLAYHHQQHPPILVKLHSTTIPIFELGIPLLPADLPRTTISATLMKSLYSSRLENPRNLSLWAPLQHVASRFETSLESLPFPQLPLVWVLHLPISMYSVFQESNSPARRCLEYIADTTNIDESRGIAVSGVRLSSDNVILVRAEVIKEELQLTIAASDSTDLGFARAHVMNKLPPSNASDGKLEKLFVSQGCYESLVDIEAKWRSCKDKFQTLYLNKTITSAEMVHLVQDVMRIELDIVHLYYKMRKLTNTRII